MRNLKRFMSGSMATLMIAMALMTGASAKSFDDVASSDVYAEQIEILSDIGVIKGTSDTEFSPNEKVTREQMAMLLFRLMIGKDTAGKTNSTSFTDLYDDTYHGAISWANASGYIIGTSDTTFEPTEGIMLQDAMTMLVRALGHETAQMNKGYPWTYIDTAVGLGLDAGLEKLGYEQELTRAEVAAILYNAISAEYLIPKTAPNGMTYYEATTIIERVFGYDIDESVIVATNDHALEGVSTVTKDGYITVHTDAGLLTVKYDELGLEGSADSHLGKNLKLVYKRDDKTKLVSVLGCTELGKSAAAEVIEFDDKHSYTMIDGVKYQVVDTLSDELSTNANELLVYAYSDTDTLVQITSNEELAALTGAFDAHIIFDSKTSGIADRLIIKPFAFGRFNVEDGEVSIADGMKLKDLTLINPDKAEDGDYVLYYFNRENEALELAAVLPVTEEATVTRLTASSVTLGGKRYELGCEKLGIEPALIRDRLAVGEKVSAVIYGNKILAIESSEVTASAPSKYLIADSDVTPVFSDGKLNYAMDAVIDGVTETIIVTNRSVTDGKVYRYTVNEKGIYTLIPARISGGSIVSGDEEFVQSGKHNNELALIIDEADGTTVTKSASHYTLSAGNASVVGSAGVSGSSVRFVTDRNTVILVNTDGEWKLSKGVYTSTVDIEDGASVTAIFANEVGSVETLRYLIVTDGSLGSVDAAASTVKIIASVGKELVDGTVYSVYTVLDLESGEIRTMNSKSAALTVGGNYLTDISGLISSTAAGATTGVVSGFTSTTVTVGDTTYKLASGAKFLKIEDSDTVSELKLEDIFMKNVELVIADGEVKSAILLGKTEFEAAYGSDKVTVSAKHNLTDADSLALVAMTRYDSTSDETEDLDIDDFTASVTDGETYTFEVTGDGAFESGEYTLAFKVNGVKFTVEFTVE